MITKPTVFIVGAGASAEFGFPLGTALTGQIRNYLMRPAPMVRNGQLAELNRRSIIELAQTRLWIHTDALRVAEDIARAMVLAPSIDVYLDSRRGDVMFAEIGKIAITTALKECEHGCAMRVQGPTLDHVAQAVLAANGSWLGRLFMLMVTGATRDRAAEIFNNVAFVVFNYDRCIEQFFHIAIANYFGIEHNDALAIVRRHLRITHVYGSLGALPMMEQMGFQYFGGRLEIDSYQAVLGAAAELRTFTEAHSSEILAGIQAQMSWARTAVFLGFGFHRQNVEILSTPEATQIETVLATVMGMSETSQDSVQSSIAKIFGRMPPTLQMLDDSCADLVASEAPFLAL